MSEVNGKPILKHPCAHSNTQKQPETHTHTHTTTNTHTHNTTKKSREEKNNPGQTHAHTHTTTSTHTTQQKSAEDLGQGAQHAPEHARCCHEDIVNVIVALSLPKVTVSYSFILPAPSFLFCGVPASPLLSALRHPRSRRRRRPFLQHTPGPEAGNRTKNKVRSNTEPNRTKNKVRSKTP